MTSKPDLGPIFLEHRAAMYRTARALLRDRGLTSSADDVVQEVMLGLVKRPPEDVRNWQAFLVNATKMRALDLLKSSAVRRNDKLDETHDRPREGRSEEEIANARLDAIAAIDRFMCTLDDRERIVVEEYLRKERPRAEVAQDLGVSPSRVSQIASGIHQKARAQSKAGDQP